MTATTIAWSDDVWNFLVGCSRVNASCDGCYAMGQAHRKMSPQHEGLTVLRPKTASRPGVDWNGKVNVVMEKIREPLRWRKPRRVFVNSMSDLFHHAVPQHVLDQAFAVMLITSLHESRGGHTYQCLTKRPSRMLAYLTNPRLRGRLALAAGRMMEDGDGWHDRIDQYIGVFGPVHPLIQLGVSVGCQAEADEFVPILQDTPAGLRWVSYEPAHGPVDFMRGGWLCCRDGDVGGPHVDWIVVGGESGPKARRFDLAWARSTIEQCRGSGTKVFVKQLGSRPISSNPDDKRHCGDTMLPSPFRMKIDDRAGADPSEWPEDLCVREWPIAPKGRWPP